MWMIIVWLIRCAMWMLTPRKTALKHREKQTCVSAAVEHGVLTLNMPSASVVLIEDAITPLLEQPIVRQAIDHGASMFLWASARSGRTDLEIDITRWVQRAIASFYVPPGMAVTAGDFLRWCARNGAPVDDAMRIVIVDKTFQEHTFVGKNKIAFPPLTADTPHASRQRRCP